MSFHRRPAIFLTVFSIVCQAQAPTGLIVRVDAGAGAAVACNALSSREFSVVVTGSEGDPAAGATVTFFLPETGPTGTFLSGFRRETVLSGADGRAFVRGILWGAEAGRLEMRISAVWQGRRGEITIPIEVSAAARPEAPVRGASSGGGARKWLLLAAAAGGALAGIAVAGKGSKSGVVAVTAPVVTPPSIGVPSITIGRPQ